MSLWIDVSALTKVNEPRTGVPRVRNTLLFRWLATPGLDVRCFEYDRREQIFREVPRDAIAAAPVSPAASPLSSVSRRAAKVLSVATRRASLSTRNAADDWYRASVRLARTLVPRRRPPTVLPPAVFGERDLVATLDLHWLGYDGRLQHAIETSGAGLAVLVYDFIPWRFPQFYVEGYAEHFSRELAHGLALAGVAIGVSDHVRRELREFCAVWEIPVPPTEVMSLGCDVGPSDSDVALPAGLTEPFVMAVGSVCPRKNYTLLYQVWRSLLEKHGDAVPQLVLVGEAGFLSGDFLYQLKHDTRVRGKILHLTGCDDRLLAKLYARCLFTLYPSVYEGSGTPVLESLAAGKLCIASDASSIPEMGGELADYHDPQDFVRCRELVEKAWLDSEYRAEREARIRREFQSTSWDRAADLYLGFLRRHFADRLAGRARGTATSVEAEAR